MYRMYLNGRGETTRILGGGNDKGVDVRLAKILEIQFLGQFHNAGGWPYIEGPSRALPLRLQRVTNLTVGERLCLHRYDAGKWKIRGRLIGTVGEERRRDNSLGILLLVFRYLGFVRGHVELRRPFPTYDR